MGFNPDHWEYEPVGEFDEQVEEFKQALRGMVAKDVNDELVRLRKENAEMRGKLRNVSQLEMDLVMAKSRYESSVSRAKMEAEQTVRRQSVKVVAEILNKPKFCVEAQSIIGPKCELCDEDRYRKYTTPLGKESKELCDCRTYTRSFRVVEFSVHSASKRSGKWMAWYKIVPMDRRNDDDYYYESSKYLKSADGVAVDEMSKDYTSYGFDKRVGAQALADAMTASLGEGDGKPW